MPMLQKWKKYMLARFQFKWIPFVVMITLLVVMVNLGFWQIRRYYFKQDILLRYHHNVSQQPYSWYQFIKSSDKEFHNVKVEGFYLNHKTVLLDNRWHNKKIGYEVLTPFVVQDDSKVLLINRGWIPRGQDRSHLPEIKLITGWQTLQGYMIKPSVKRFILGNNIEQYKSWPVRIQYINLHQIENAIDRPMHSYVLRLAPGTSSGFVRQWKLVAINPSKHMGYAVQWFAMSLALVIAYLFFSCYQSVTRKTGGDHD